MKLKEFVAQSIIQIMEGAKEAQKRATELSGIVNPYTEEGPERMGLKTYKVKELSHIEFEVSITDEDKKGKADGLKVLFGAISLSGAADRSESQMALNRLKFKIPVIYPMYPLGNE